MFKKIKSKLRSNLKVLKFSKRYLSKYYSLSAINPRELKDGDFDWDLTLLDFLRSVHRFSRLDTTKFLEVLSSDPSKIFSIQNDRSLVLPFSLLWLISHYISAPASSHGLGLAYIGREIGRAHV